MNKLILISIVSLFSSNAFATQYISYKGISWLPPTLIERLEKQNCEIPNILEWNEGLKVPVTGVLVGQFAIKGQYDIAVICHSGEQNNIYIHWGGAFSCPSVISGRGENIEIVGEDYIKRHYEMFGGNKPPIIEHDAINDQFVGKSSIVKYCENGKWIDFSGAD